MRFFGLRFKFAFCFEFLLIFIEIVGLEGFRVDGFRVVFRLWFRAFSSCSCWWGRWSG